MIHWPWLLLIVPAVFFMGFWGACIIGANRIMELKRELWRTEDERKKLADALRKKCLGFDLLKREVKRLKK